MYKEIFAMVTFLAVINTDYLQSPFFCDARGRRRQNNQTLLVRDNELRNLSEELFSKDTNTLYQYVSAQFQNQTTTQSSTDKAPYPLFLVDPQVFEIGTVKLLVKLYDNYELDTRQEEHVTEEEVAEETELIRSILATEVIQRVMDFLADKGYFKKDHEEYEKIFKNIWFDIYSRGKGSKGRLTSSGFEHVFLAEKKIGRKIIGLHNWIFFGKEEIAKQLNYFGFIRNIKVPGRTLISQVQFLYKGKRKVSTMFIGTSPELEMALYTMCFFARPDHYCRLSFDGIKFGIQTYTWHDGQKNLIAAAFPVV